MKTAIYFRRIDDDNVPDFTANLFEQYVNKLSAYTIISHSISIFHVGATMYAVFSFIVEPVMTKHR
jgi:hypothetical protein